jgi:hypothetical protein
MAPLTLGGQCNNLSVPVGQFSIDTTGNMIGGNSGSFNEASCGNYDYVGSGGFFGRDFKVSITATSRTCYNFNFTANLSRN